MRVGLCDLRTACVSANSHLLTCKCLNQTLKEFLPSVCVPVCVSLLSLLGKGSVKCIPPFNARQRLGKQVPTAVNTHNNKRIAERLCLCIPLSLPGKNSVKTLPRQRKIVGGVVFYAVRVVSKESRRLVLRITSCFIIC
jgi:hypothetical protein